MVYFVAVTDTAWVGLFSLLSTTVTMIGTVIIAWFSTQTKQKMSNIETQTEQIAVKQEAISETQSVLASDLSEVKTHTNSMKDALVEQAKAIGHAEGREEQRTSQIEFST